MQESYIKPCKQKTSKNAATLVPPGTQFTISCPFLCLQFYSYLSQQQNMMQDFVRTNTYQTAMLSNLVDFADKVVLDVGAGSGIDRKSVV